MPHTVSRTIFGMSTYASVVISPATPTSPVVSNVSHATRPFGSSPRIASRTASEIWSAILSGWPSVTDSEVKVQRSLTLVASSLSVPPGDHGVQHGSGDATFVHQGNIGGAPGGIDDDDPVGVVLEAGLGRCDIVRHDQVETLPAQLGSRVVCDGGGLGREADQRLTRALGATQAGEDVRRRLEHDLREAVVLLDLLGRDGLGPEVGDRGG